MKQFFSWSIAILGMSFLMQLIMAALVTEYDAVIALKGTQCAMYCMCVILAMVTIAMERPMDRETCVEACTTLTCCMVSALMLNAWAVGARGEFAGILAALTGCMGCVLAGIAGDENQAHPIWMIAVAILVIGIVGTNGAVTIAAGPAMGMAMAGGGIAAAFLIEHRALAPPRPCIGGLPESADTGRVS